jgi:3-isopropylmalate dehydrogenase
MRLNIAVLPGDGIGPEIIEQALRVTKAVCEKFGHELITKNGIVGATAIDQVGDPYPEETHQLCMESDAVLFGAIGHPRFDNDPTA